MQHIDTKWLLYQRLMRLDKPAGIWLLMWPCFWGVSLATENWPSLMLLLLFALGAVIMRSAGCMINDLVDRGIDAEVARTRTRPLASGAVSRPEAIILTGLLLVLGLLIAWSIHHRLLYWSPLVLALIVAYPYMKRFTWWPQAFLGITFNLGVLFGWIGVAGAPDLPAFALYLGAVCWTIGYDTIYAHQDIEDDMRLGVKSTAIRFGDNSRAMIGGFYALFAVLLLGAGITAEVGPVYYIGVALAIAQLSWQVLTVELDKPASCLARFKSNTWLGMILFLSMVMDRVIH